LRSLGGLARTFRSCSAICSGLSTARISGVGLDGGAEIASSSQARMAWACTVVGLLAQHAGGGEIQQQLAGEDQAAREIQVAAHALGIDQQLIHQP
jgi:hypothetical protein